MPIHQQLILWKPLYRTSLGMYLLIILFWLPFPYISTLLLFAILCLWSRVPCMVSWFTKDVDVIDFFVVFLAININGFFAGCFGFFMMLFSRIFGPGEDLEYTIKDGFAFFFGGLMTPLIYAMTGHNLLITMYLFTIIGRYGVVIVIDLIFAPGKALIDLSLIAAGVPIAYFSNTFLVTVFGNSLNNLFDTGMKPNFGLFLLVTAVVGGFFLLSYILEKGEKDTKSLIRAKKQDYSADFIQEPHKVFLSYFIPRGIPEIISGSFKNFKLKVFLLTFALMSFILINHKYVPKWHEIILIVIFLFILINILVYGLHYIGSEETRGHIK